MGYVRELVVDVKKFSGDVLELSRFLDIDGVEIVVRDGCVYVDEVIVEPGSYAVKNYLQNKVVVEIYSGSDFEKYFKFVPGKVKVGMGNKGCFQDKEDRAKEPVQERDEKGSFVLGGKTTPIILFLC